MTTRDHRCSSRRGDPPSGRWCSRTGVHGKNGRARGTMIDVRDVTKTYRKGRLRVEVLRSVSLQAGDGAFLALMGASGSGKTTLLNLIGGIDSPSSGSIEVNDVRVDLMGERQLAKW